MCPICQKKLIEDPSFRQIWWLAEVKQLMLHCPAGHGSWLGDDLLTAISVKLAQRGRGVDSD